MHCLSSGPWSQTPGYCLGSFSRIPEIDLKGARFWCHPSALGTEDEFTGLEISVSMLAPAQPPIGSGSEHSLALDGPSFLSLKGGELLTLPQSTIVSNM